jgi:hypothetical protein
MTTLMREGAAEVTPTGMKIEGDLTLEQWADIGKKIGRASTAFQLAVGDWLVYGQEHFEGAPALQGLERKAGRVASDLLDYACTLTGIDRAILSNYAYTARKVACSLRNEQLTYQHYVVLAKLPEPEQTEWVDLATSHGERIPTRQLANSIKLSEKSGEKRIWPKEEIVKAAMADKPVFIDAPETVLDRFIRSMERQNFDEWTEEMKMHLRRRFARAYELIRDNCGA